MHIYPPTLPKVQMGKCFGGDFPMFFHYFQHIPIQSGRASEVLFWVYFTLFTLRNFFFIFGELMGAGLLLLLNFYLSFYLIIFILFHSSLQTLRKSCHSLWFSILYLTCYLMPLTHFKCDNFKLTYWSQILWILGFLTSQWEKEF